MLKGEAFLYTNYFGLKQSFVYELYKIYGSHLIVDNSQAFFAPQVNSVDTFWSARKFFGVPNGAFLNCGKVLERQIPVDYTIDIAKHLLERIDVSAEFGFSDFHKSEEYHNGREICYMSQLSYAILKNVDYDSVISSRRSNYSILDKAISSTNIFHFTMNEQDVPMAYPYFCFDENLMRKLLS